MKYRKLILTLACASAFTHLLADNTHQLRIIHGEKGTVAIEVKHGEQKTVTIKNDPNYKIEKVVYNGKDVTNEVKANGEYTTPAINSDATLKITFKEEE